jgi:hypothetical protein
MEIRDDGNLLLVEDADNFRQRWEMIQAQFVDEPRRAIEEADALVQQLIRSLTETFADERRRLEQQWKAGRDVSTDELRQGLQRYRSFFRRLLSQTAGVGETGGTGELPAPDPRDRADGATG